MDVQWTRLKKRSVLSQKPPAASFMDNFRVIYRRLIIQSVLI